MARKNQYLNNRKLLECILDHKERSKEREARGLPAPPVPEYAGRCILLLCNRMGTRFNFCGYSYRDEMVGDAIVDCVNAFYNFDPYRFSNPFGYLSRVAWNAMIRKIYTEKKETYLKHKSLQVAFIHNEHYDAPADWTDPNAVRVGGMVGQEVKAASSNSGPSSISDGIVTEFEGLLGRRKEKRERRSEDARA